MLVLTALTFVLIEQEWILSALQSSLISAIQPNVYPHQHQVHFYL